ncbi:MAG: aminopeptidase [candidate division Zixibacteria bacterium]|nr:aminopeptidase [candidate division Zixibacteria bacterium]
MSFQRVCFALIVSLLIAFGSVVFAGDNGGIPEKLVKKLNQTDYSNPEKAMMNIVANKSIKDIALNRETFIEHNKYMGFKIKTGSITNQKSSGRCWMFSGLNVVRPQMMKNLEVDELELSQNYLMFWDKMEKFNRFLQYMIDFADRGLDDRELQLVIDGPGGDGGWWSYFTGLIKKYGLVPKEIMPETYNSSSSGYMNSFLRLTAKEMAAKLRQGYKDGVSKKELETTKQEMMTEIYRILVYNLGQPPTEFEWRHKTSDTTVEGTITEKFTPKEFAEKAISDNLDDYIALFNYPGKDFNKNYSLEMSRNMYDEPNFTIVNVPIDTMIIYAQKSILDSTPVWFACDVGKETYNKDGIMALDIYDYESILGTEFNMTKKDMIQLWMISPTHAMAFMGIDTADGKPRKWLVENSWGGDKGADGYWYMYDDWFRRYMFGVIIHKRYLSKELVKIAESKPTILPPWDPMYALTKLQ